MWIEVKKRRKPMEIIKDYINSNGTSSLVLYKQSMYPLIDGFNYFMRRYGRMDIYKHDNVWHLTINKLWKCQVSIIFDSTFLLENMDIQYRTFKIQDNAIKFNDFSRIGEFKTARLEEHKQCIIDYISKMILGTY